MTPVHLPRRAYPRGIRVCVHKAAPNLGWTTIYLPGRKLAKLLEISAGSIPTITSACRSASRKATAAPPRTWSGVVLDGAVALLEKEQAITNAVAAAAARENNAAWDAHGVTVQFCRPGRRHEHRR